MSKLFSFFVNLFARVFGSGGVVSMMFPILFALGIWKVISFLGIGVLTAGVGYYSIKLLLTNFVSRFELFLVSAVGLSTATTDFLYYALNALYFTDGFAILAIAYLSRAAYMFAPRLGLKK